MKHKDSIGDGLGVMNLAVSALTKSDINIINGKSEGIILSIKKLLDKYTLDELNMVDSWCKIKGIINQDT